MLEREVEERRMEVKRGRKSGGGGWVEVEVRVDEGR